MIRYIDILSLRLFGGGGSSFNLAKRCHSTARAVFAGIRAGTHCVSQRHILRGDFWKIFTTRISETLNILDKLFYIDWLSYFTNHGSLRLVAMIWPFSVGYLLRAKGRRIPELVS